MSRWICTGCGQESPSRERLLLACPELYHDLPQCANRSLLVEQLELPAESGTLTSETSDGGSTPVRRTR